MGQVVLRAVEPEDLDFLYKIENDMTLWDVSSTNMNYSRYLLNESVAHCSGDIYTDKQQRLVIELSEGQVIGLADLVNFEPRHQRAEVGLLVSREYRGKGYGTQALRQIIDYARKILHLHQLYAYIDVANNISLTLFEQNGFQQSVRLTDWILSEDGYHDVVVMQYFL